MQQSSFQKLSFFALAFLMPLFLRAQDETKKLDVDIDVNKGGSGGGMLNNPVIWVVGAAVFILLLVALMRGRNKA